MWPASNKHNVGGTIRTKEVLVPPIVTREHRPPCLLESAESLTLAPWLMHGTQEAGPTCGGKAVGDPTTCSLTLTHELSIQMFPRTCEALHLLSMVSFIQSNTDSGLAPGTWARSLPCPWTRSGRYLRLKLNCPCVPPSLPPLSMTAHHRRLRSDIL